MDLISAAVPKPVTNRSEDGLDVMVFTLVPVLILAVIIAIVYWFYRQRKLAYFNEVGQHICLNEVY
jgi:ethanolamine transporter EutH